jgi:hypothetical protein
VDEACGKLDLDEGSRASHQSCRIEAGEHGAGGVAEEARRTRHATSSIL